MCLSSPRPDQAKSFSFSRDLLPCAGSGPQWTLITAGETLPPASSAHPVASSVQGPLH